MTPPPVIQRWIEIIEGDHLDQLADLLAEDAVFYSPAIFSPQEGRATTLTYLTAAAKLFGGNDFRYVGQWFAEHSAVLEFTADLDGVHVNGIDMIEWNEAGQIVSFKVMLRPFKAIQTVMLRMSELLQQG